LSRVAFSAFEIVDKGPNCTCVALCQHLGKECSFSFVQTFNGGNRKVSSSVVKVITYELVFSVFSSFVYVTLNMNINMVNDIISVLFEQIKIYEVFHKRDIHGM
jgi:hypothetical protein